MFVTREVDGRDESGCRRCGGGLYEQRQLEAAMKKIAQRCRFRQRARVGTAEPA